VYGGLIGVVLPERARVVRLAYQPLAPRMAAVICLLAIVAGIALMLRPGPVPDIELS
jgi:hypothetical protein